MLSKEGSNRIKWLTMALCVDVQAIMFESHRDTHDDILSLVVKLDMSHLLGDSASNLRKSSVLQDV